MAVADWLWLQGHWSSSMNTDSVEPSWKTPLRHELRRTSLLMPQERSMSSGFTCRTMGRSTLALVHLDREPSSPRGTAPGALVDTGMCGR